MSYNELVMLLMEKCEEVGDLKGRLEIAERQIEVLKDILNGEIEEVQEMSGTECLN